MSLEGERPIVAQEPAYIDENAVVDGRYESYSTMRTFGWVTVIGSAVVGSALLFSGINDCSTTAPGSACELMDMPLLVRGAAITVGAALPGSS